MVTLKTSKKTKTTRTTKRTSKPPASVRAAKAKRKSARRSAAGAVANMLIEPDIFADQLVESMAQTEAGEGMVTSAQAERMIAGIALPSLAMRGIIGHDILPLGRNIMNVGLPGSCKSAFLAEMYRWVLQQKGIANHIETENKDSPDLRNSILNYDPSMMRRMLYNPAGSQQEWMEAFNGFIKVAEGKFADTQEKKRGVARKKNETPQQFRARVAAKQIIGKPGWVYPLIIGVDSLTAVSSDSTILKILAEGAPERRWQIEAQYLSDFAKTLPRLLRTKPIILATNNHLKPGQNDLGHAVDKIPGGQAMRFMNTMEFKLVAMQPVKTVEYSGVRIKIACIKNSLGETHNWIVVDFRWWWEISPETGLPVQRSVWDWDTAAMRYLLAQKSVSAKRWNAINEVVDLHPSDSVTTPTIWSKALGISSKSPVRLYDAGVILESRKDLLEALYPILHIRRRAHFKAGTNYTHFQRQLIDSAEALAGSLDDGGVVRTIDLSTVTDITDALDEAMANKELKKKKKKATSLFDDIEMPSIDDVGESASDYL